MSLLALLVALVIICLAFWAVRMLLAAFSIGEPIATVVYVIMVILVIVWLLSAFTGGSLGTIRL